MGAVGCPGVLSGRLRVVDFCWVCGRAGARRAGGRARESECDKLGLRGFGVLQFTGFWCTTATCYVEKYN